MDGQNLKRIQISRELRRTEVDGDYVPTRRVNLWKQKTTTGDDLMMMMMMIVLSCLVLYNCNLTIAVLEKHFI